MIANKTSFVARQNDLVLRDCMHTLRRIAEFRLPNALDRRLLWLSENKEQLDDEQRNELAALVDLADHRGLDKVEAQAVLMELMKAYPELVNGNA
jgi:hypothetical protein